MIDLEKLGANIRSLRNAYGETQAQLGEAIFVESNTVSYYETGQRRPSKETLAAIADHYFVSIEELLYCDYSVIESITLDKDALRKNIYLLLPIVSTKKAIKNENFKNAFDAHKELYAQIHDTSIDEIGTDHIDECFDGYYEAMEDDEIEAEAAANFLALWYFMKHTLKSCTLIKNNPAAIRQVVAKDAKVRKEIEYFDSDFLSDVKELLREFNDDELKDFISEKLISVKRSKKLSDLGDYYLALQYTWNLVDNGLSWGFNQRIGAEMMDAFARVQNKYAARFIKLNRKYVRVRISQFVDDKH